MKQKKYIIILLIFFFGVNNLKAQVSDVITGLNYPGGIAFYGNELYFSQYNGTISKININDNPLNIEEVINTGNILGEFEIINDYLYFANFSGNKISKINLTIANPTIIDVLDVFLPSGLKASGNKLYFSSGSGSSTVLNQGKVSFINISDSNPIPQEVLTGQAYPLSLELKNNYLFISDKYDNKITKINLSDTTYTPIDFISGLNEPTGLIFNGDILYISEQGNNKITKIDTSNTVITLVDFITGLGGPAQMDIKLTDMYITETLSGKISKSENTMLSVKNFSLEKVNVFPNPSYNFIQISGFESRMSISIYDVIGNELLKQVVVNNQKIDISHLNTGIYFLKFENNEIFKICKK
ncbi:T9SS type A sorting domain-containing protein [Mesoflavibacter sp. CH_XMU1404-2]|uniref:T9SS type A sorting domain-containing protein n=1 Tax=Mesoflavibacter sp. CH_XMU1404-2 TaxID=3107766 RepID=UPI00243FEB4B